MIFPLIFESAYWMYVFTIAMIFSIFAASWDFLAGIAGQVSFGHALFLGIAGYSTAALIKFYGFPWFISLLIGTVVAVGFGLIIGIPSLRLKGPYLALGTLGFSLILYQLFYTGNFLGGTEGISSLPPVSSDPTVIFYIILAFMLLSFIVLHVSTDSKFGTILKSIRDDETCAAASGINTTKYKLFAFMISGFFAGLAGGLLTLVNTAVNPAYYQPLYSFYAIIMAAIGGIATISGSINGAFLFMILTELLRDFGEWSLLIFAIILILIIRFADRGIMNPTIERLKEFWDYIRRK